MRVAEPLETKLCAFEDEIAIVKLKSYKSPRINQSASERFQAGCQSVCLENHKFINSIWNKIKLVLLWTVSISGLV